LNEENIKTVKYYILVPKDKAYSMDFFKLIDHSTRGQIKNKNVYGLHFYDPEKIKIIELIGNKNPLGVWAARIEALNPNTNQWIEKKGITTFFPINWTGSQVFLECAYAFEHKEKVADKNNIYSSTTLSGIQVEIIIENNEVKTIYPIL
jgi:hypothetical protein